VPTPSPFDGANIHTCGQLTCSVEAQYLEFRVTLFESQLMPVARTRAGHMKFIEWLDEHLHLHVKQQFIESLATVLGLEKSRIRLDNADIYWKAMHFRVQVKITNFADANALKAAITGTGFRALMAKELRSYTGIAMHPENPASVFVSDVYVHEMVITHHSMREFYKAHLCAYNKLAEKCECLCWGDRFYDESSVVGEHFFAPGSVDTTELGLSDNNRDTVCQFFRFPEQIRKGVTGTEFRASTFDHRLQADEVKVLTTPSFSTDMLQFEPVSTWVETTTHFGFEACIQGSDQFWRSYTESKSAAPVKLQFFAWQRQQPLLKTYVQRGTLSGRAVIGTSWQPQSGNKPATKCVTVTFDHAFSARPLVTGSMEREQLSDGESARGTALATTWVESIETTHFKVCAYRAPAIASEADLTEITRLRAQMKEAAQNEQYMQAAGIKKKIRKIEERINANEEAILFSWFAFPHYTLVRLPRFVASVGHVKAEKWHKDESGLDQADDLFITCKQVRYNHTFDRIPTVLAVANRQAHGPIHATMVMENHTWHVKNSTEAQHKPVLTYVKDLTTSGFKVCSRLLANSGDASSLHWDYVAMLSMEENGHYTANATHMPEYLPGVHPAVNGVVMRGPRESHSAPWYQRSFGDKHWQTVRRKHGEEE
jgi:hypothetical protein